MNAKQCLTQLEVQILLFIDISQFCCTYCLHNIQIQMQIENSSSSRSNLLVLSRDSSKTYSNTLSNLSSNKFAHKIKKLLECENMGLKEVYRRVQTIVVNYFHENKIIQLKQMQQHLSAIKCNNQRIKDIVSALQTNLLTDKLQNKIVNQQDKLEFNSHNHLQNPEPSLQESKIMRDSDPTVNTSIKYNFILKPSFNEANIQNQEQTVLEVKKDKEDFKSRNQFYESKISHIYDELRQIKAKLQKGANKNEAIKLLSKQKAQQQELMSQQTIIQDCNQRHFQTKDTDESQERLQEQMKTKKQQKSQFAGSKKLEEYAATISKQIEELKQTTSKIKIESQPLINQANQIKLDVKTEQIGKEGIGQVKKAILQQISNTSSKIEVSMEHIAEREKNVIDKRQELDVQLNRSLSNVSFRKQALEHNISLNEVARSNTNSLRQIHNRYYLNSSIPLPSSPMNNLYPVTSFNYNPPVNSHSPHLQTLKVRPNQLKQLPIVRPMSVENPIRSSSRISNNLSTSILHPHLFANNQSNRTINFKTAVQPQKIAESVYFNSSLMPSSKDNIGNTLKKRGLALSIHS